MKKTSEIRCEGVVDDVAVPSASGPVELGSQSVGRVAGFSEIDTNDSADGKRGKGSGVASPDNISTCGDDDALSVHSSGSDARYDLVYLLDQPGRLLSYLLMAS